MTGVISRLIEDRGFGFIRVPGQKKDVFFHLSGLAGTRYEDLKVDDKVDFEIEQAEKGPRATNIRLV